MPFVRVLRAIQLRQIIEDMAKRPQATEQKSQVNRFFGPTMASYWFTQAKDTEQPLHNRI